MSGQGENVDNDKLLGDEQNILMDGIVETNNAKVCNF